MFNKFIFLIHHDLARQFYVNVNVLHERDFEVIVYHVKKKKITYNKKDIEFILFLSKILTSVEFRYWSIELKTVDLIWLMKKIKHIIETIKLISQIIIYTNHSTIINIMKQFKFAFNNIDKLNLRLIKIFTYLFQFAFDIYHKSSKQHIVSDVLSRLLFNIESMKQIIDLNFDMNEKMLNMIYHVTLIKISNEFKKKFKKTYKKNKRWIRIIKFLIKNSIESNSKNWINFEDLRFKYCKVDIVSYPLTILELYMKDVKCNRFISIDCL